MGDIMADAFSAEALAEFDYLVSEQGQFFAFYAAQEVCWLFSINVAIAASEWRVFRQGCGAVW